MSQELGLSWKNCQILLVDDEAFSRGILRRALEKAGITRIAEATSGDEGLELARRLCPDLVLLDINMPGMDGYEMCRRLRASPETADIAVIFQTALNSEKERADCFSAGGSDVINKPVSARECVARVRLHLERLMLVRDLKMFNRRVAGELAMARTMQAALVPEARDIDRINKRYGCSVEARFESCSELGGDFWTIFEIDDGHLGFLVADFAGHGIAAALNAFRLHTLVSRMPPETPDPSVWMTSLNTHLRKLLPVGQFCTAFFGVLDLESRIMRYSAASSPRPLLLSQGQATRLDSSGMFLGVTPMAVYETREILIPPGADLILYSDAITEARDKNDNLLGEETLATILLEVSAKRSQNRVGAVMNCLEELAEFPLTDDLTLVWIHF